MTKEEFIEKAKRIHNNKYDYSKVVYKNGESIIKIICPIHGEFEQVARTHLKGRGCKECGEESKKIKRIISTDEFIRRAKEIHGDKYDYSKVDMYNRDEKGRVCIVCPIHGEFWQNPQSHMKGVGCSKCSNNYNFSTVEFVDFLRKKYGDYFDYTKVNYVNANTEVTIICPEHGEFKRKPKYFTNNDLKYCCPFCNKKNLGVVRHNKLKETFFNKAKELYGDKYDFSKTVLDGDKNVIIINKENNEEFLVKPGHFLNGKDYQYYMKYRKKLKKSFIKKAKEVHRRKV